MQGGAPACTHDAQRGDLVGTPAAAGALFHAMDCACIADDDPGSVPAGDRGSSVLTVVVACWWAGADTGRVPLQYLTGLHLAGHHSQPLCVCGVPTLCGACASCGSLVVCWRPGAKRWCSPCCSCEGSASGQRRSGAGSAALQSIQRCGSACHIYFSFSYPLCAAVGSKICKAACAHHQRQQQRLALGCSALCCWCFISAAACRCASCVCAAAGSRHIVTGAHAKNKNRVVGLG